VAGFSFRKVCRSGQMAGEGSCPADPPLGSGPDDWGCVYDNVSHLTWEAKTADGGLHDGSHRFTNRSYDAHDDPNDAAWLVDATNAEALCGATNWRLPGALELQSIVHYGVGVPGRTGAMTDPVFFPYTTSSWTRDESVYANYAYAWHVDFSLGGVDPEERSRAMGAQLVHRAPHQEQTLAEGRFIVSPDGTEVTDSMTGLVWRRCAEGQTWKPGTQKCKGTSTQFDWPTMLDYAGQHRAGGWRIPNIKELFSLVRIKGHFGHIDHRAFPNASGSFMSSTPLQYAGEIDVQIVEFGSGWVTHRSAYEERAALLMVRGGRE
jgi:hypothetical protein